MKRTVIVERPVILDLMSVQDGGSKIRKPSEFEKTLRINGCEYSFIGALLYNGQHYRSLAFIKGRYLEYDGMFQKNKLQWYNDENKQFSGNFYATKSWYICVGDHGEGVADTILESCVGYPKGESIEPMRQHRLTYEKCTHCGE